MEIDSKQYPVKAQISPQSLAGAGTASSSWVAVGAARRISVLGLAGVMTGASLTFKLEQASDGSGTGAKDLKTGTTIADTADNTAQQFDANPAELDQENGFTYVRVTVTAGAGTSALVAAALILAGPDSVS